ncbi:phage tail tape measure protein, TP901 family, core region [Alkalithermobacter thermoalcaliphilus JW-YL-7 = DSM 7308]|uniref:Phage tail tape measure protein, TP901 family n=1 Tax=Alkalithermobacter thermoalcaliphilus JW-YL-7 = DSM 7308 TaxID=1121328 RepID=A0A150FQY7_CLOPD|nr:phage tail tape measure protein, TP901 family [[Clostridium] paradoxum JW-YL-7 = DSM 7308]SHL13848.1 phage tail tape measure protein, TP901 family, core region [[Clostridium] paradoxum JW-YL-7 = DSM 7308]
MSLLVKIGADLSSFEKQMKKATREISYIGQTLQNAGKTMTTRLTLPILGVGAAVVKTSADFESSMSKVQAITGATGQDFKHLQETAKKLGATTMFSAKQSAEAMTYLGMAGYDTNQIIAAMPGLLDLAAASGADLATTADIVSDAMTAFGMSADKTSKFADLLASVSSKANTNVEMLGESFKYVAPVAGALGYKVEDVSLALGLMANAGIKGSQAGTTLRSAITRLTKPTAQASKLMHELGLEITDAEGNMLPFRDIIEQLRGKFSNLTAEQQAQYAATIFGQEAMSGMLAIINATDEDYKKLIQATSNYTGEAKKMADTMQNNLQGQLTKLKSALEGIAIQLGETLIPIISKVVDKIIVWVDWFANLDDSTKELILKIALVVAAIGPLLIVVGKAITLFGQLKAAALILGPVIAGISAPVSITIGVIGGLIAIGVALWKNWDTIVAKAAAMKGAVISVWNGMYSGIKSIINKIISAMNGMINGLNRVKFDIPNWIPGLGGKSFGLNIPRIPMLAKGGKAIGPTLAMIGEGADEEAVLPLNRKIFSEIAKGISSQIKQADSNLLQSPIITIQNMTVRNDNDIELIARKLHSMSNNRLRGVGAW